MSLKWVSREGTNLALRSQCLLDFYIWSFTDPWVAAHHAAALVNKQLNKDWSLVDKFMKDRANTEKRQTSKKRNYNSHSRRSGLSNQCNTCWHAHECQQLSLQSQESNNKLTENGKIPNDQKHKLKFYKKLKTTNRTTQSHNNAICTHNHAVESGFQATNTTTNRNGGGGGGNNGNRKPAAQDPPQELVAEQPKEEELSANKEHGDGKSPDDSNLVGNY